MFRGKSSTYYLLLPRKDEGYPGSRICAKYDLIEACGLHLYFCGRHVKGMVPTTNPEVTFTVVKSHGDSIQEIKKMDKLPWTKIIWKERVSIMTSSQCPITGRWFEVQMYTKDIVFILPWREFKNNSREYVPKATPKKSERTSSLKTNVCCIVF